MDKAKIMRLWAELGEARPTYEEFERAMTRPVRVNQYAFVDPAEVADVVALCCSPAGAALHGSVVNADGGFGI